jgi:hypothetical protein
MTLQRAFLESCRGLSESLLLYRHRRSPDALSNHDRTDRSLLNKDN